MIAVLTLRVSARGLGLLVVTGQAWAPLPSGVDTVVLLSGEEVY